MEQSDYYDHYKDTLSLQHDTLAERNKFTAAMLIVMVLLAGFIYDPATLNKEVNTCVSNYVNGLAFEIKYVNTGLVFLTLWIIVRYYQLEHRSQKLSNYLVACEERLSLDKEFEIYRERYLVGYPNSFFRRVLNVCLVLFLPIGIIIISLVRIYSELSWNSDFRYVDFVGLFLIIIFSLLYLSTRFFREEFFDRKRYPELKLRQRILKYLRLEK